MPPAGASSWLLRGAAVVVAILVLAAGWLPRDPQPQAWRLSGFTMGTSWEVRAVVPAGMSPPAELAPAVRALLAYLDREVLSTWAPESELSRFNALPPGGRLNVSSDLLEVVTAALDVHAQSGGAFDMTVKPLTDLWGFGPEPVAALPPEAAAIEQARSRVDSDAVRVAGDTLAKTAAVELDLSAIAKGHALDRVAALLEERGLNDYLIEIGGELKAAGATADGTPWRIGIESPRGGGSPAAAIGSGGDTLVFASSGDYRNFTEAGGRVYPHVIDPRDGRPVDHDLASVTVVHDSGARADAWATALLVLGAEEGLALAAGLDLPAYFIIESESDLKHRHTASFGRYLMPAQSSPE